jgi:hypothetical protein
MSVAHDGPTLLLCTSRKQLGGWDGCFLDPQLLHVSSLSLLLS